VPKPTTDDPVAKAFGKAVREARDDRELTLETVAARVRRTTRSGRTTTMDWKYLQAIENGHHAVSIITAKLIADALEIPLAELFAEL